MDFSEWPAPPALPLGDPYTGECRAEAGHPRIPEAALLRRYCNLGYAAGNCPHMPETSGPDAVRFAVEADGGASVRIHYVLERGHQPLEHGLLEFSRQSRSFLAPPEAMLAAQARAYAESYLRRVPAEA